MIMNRLKVFILTCILFAILPTPKGRASTGVGSGGDAIDLFLKTTQQILVELVGYLRSPNASTALKNLCTCPTDMPNHIYCRHLQTLNLEQVELCRNYIIETLDQYLMLNYGETKIPIQLTSKKLEVLDPNGFLRPVTAITELGPKGPIWFNEERARTLNPLGMFALLAHEVGHKVSFRGIYIDDNPPAWSFSEPGGGRALLDAVGAGLVTAAVDRHLLGEYFTVMDRFLCRITDLTSGFSMDSSGTTPRTFTALPSLDHYRTGVGRSNEDFSCQLRETNRSSIVLRVEMREEVGCASPQKIDERGTQVELWRVFDTQGNSETPQPQLISATHYDGLNPVCLGPHQRPVEVEFAGSNRPFKFSLVYQGSEGTLQ